MIEASQLSFSPSEARPAQNPAQNNEGGEAPSFSLALAAASLQSQAAVSLNVHGAAPSDGAAANGFTAQNSGRGNDSEAQTRTSETPARQSLPQGGREAGAAQTANSSARNNDVFTAPAPHHGQPSSSASQNSAHNVAAPGLTTAQAAAQPQQQNAAREAAALRDTAARQTANEAANEAARNTKPATAARASEAQNPQQDFARLLARRIDRATAFDLRLDPPELGRVEGRFTVADDGKTVLALKFDNQTALDLFTKDQAALHTALADAGFDASDHGFSFSLREDNDGQPNNALQNDQTGAAPSAIAAAFNDPLFNAPFSEGVIDIRI